MKLSQEIDRKIKKNHIPGMLMLKSCISGSWENTGPEVKRNLVSSIKSI